MQCEKCGAKLEVVRKCSQVRLKCKSCCKEYRVHEVASRLDSETENVLSNFTSIIYD